jgi:hypothetical protein
MVMTVYRRRFRTTLNTFVTLVVGPSSRGFLRHHVSNPSVVYIVWSYEVIRQMKRWGFRLIHCDVDDRPLGANGAVSQLKRNLFLLPMYRLAGSTAADGL